MKDIIKTLLLEWQEAQLPSTIAREVNLTAYQDLSIPKIVAVTGFRRVGKTYLLMHFIQELLRGRDRKAVVYLNFEDERIPPDTKILTQLLPTIKETFGHAPEFLFLDEVHVIPQWSRWLRRIADRERIRIFVTGSSSKMSSREIPTELRGRCLEVQTYPLSFREFLTFKGVAVDAERLDYLEDQKARVLFNLEEYLLYGGMPEVVLSPEAKKKEILQQYYASVLERDVIERYAVKNEVVLKALGRLLLNATSYSISKLYGTLKSMQLKIGKTTLNHYLHYLESAYFLFSLPIFSYKVKDQLQYPRKHYLIDNGFLTALSLKFSKDYGRLLENLAAMELRRLHPHGELAYWRDPVSKKEVDFVVREDAGVSALIQVCSDLSDPETKKREYAALVKASGELGCRNLWILTRDEALQEKFSGKDIKVVPVWKWLFGKSGPGIDR